jgi:hypothetical protein
MGGDLDLVQNYFKNHTEHKYKIEEIKVKNKILFLE